MKVAITLTFRSQHDRIFLLNREGQGVRPQALLQKLIAMLKMDWFFRVIKTHRFSFPVK
jgi:hypothetical protein